ncbi:MAG: hypothetical protein JO079_00860, partial [Frankiaceae bacterium]|nr:hypothetical protein [Frankiaceae bacterium]
MTEVELRLRDLLTDDHLAVRVPADLAEAVHAGVRRRRRHARIASSAAVVAVVAAVAGAAVPLLLSKTSGPPRHVVADRPQVWAPGTLTALPAALHTPSAMAVSGGVVWVAGNGVLARIDVTSRHVTTRPTGPVTDLAATPRHLWVARRCALELHKTNDGTTVSTSALPCDGGGVSGPAVTANGARAWVASDDGSRTHVRVYTVGDPQFTAERVLPGRLAGAHLLAIGGHSVYVVTSSGEGSVLHELSADDLRPLATIAVPGARFMAYGSDQLFVADATGVVAYPPDLSSRRTLVTGAVSTLTTGSGLVWCNPGGASLVGLDAAAGRTVDVTALPAEPDGLLRADGDALWSVR